MKKGKMYIVTILLIMLFCNLTYASAFDTNVQKHIADFNKAKQDFEQATGMLSDAINAKINGQLVQNGNNFYFVKNDGTIVISSWVLIDLDNDNWDEWYYFGSDGALLVNCVTPDGSTVNEVGQWIKNGNVQHFNWDGTKFENSNNVNMHSGQITNTSSNSIHLCDNLYFLGPTKIASSGGDVELIQINGEVTILGEYKVKYNIKGSNVRKMHEGKPFISFYLVGYDVEGFVTERHINIIKNEDLTLNNYTHFSKETVKIVLEED